MTQDRATPNSGANQTPYQQMVADSYYAVLGIQPAASAQQIRQAYRDLSKLYHPDTTTLAGATATSKFQQLNEAYATLSNPERRRLYDQKIGYSRVAVVQPLPSLKQTARAPAPSSAYLDATDRPLSPGEIFAIFILGLTVVGCLVLAIAIGITRGPAVLEPVTAIVPQKLGAQKSGAQKLGSPILETPTLGTPTLEMPTLETPTLGTQKLILQHAITPAIDPQNRLPLVVSRPPLAPSPLPPTALIPAASPSPSLQSTAGQPETQIASPKALNSVRAISVQPAAVQPAAAQPAPVQPAPVLVTAVQPNAAGDPVDAAQPSDEQATDLPVPSTPIVSSPTVESGVD